MSNTGAASWERQEGDDRIEQAYWPNTALSPFNICRALLDRCCGSVGAMCLAQATFADTQFDPGCKS